MRILNHKKVFQKEIEKIIYEINHENLFERYCFFIFGIFISALAFNVFYVPNQIVTGGTTGLSILFNGWFNFEPSTFIFIVSLGLLILSFFLLGLKTTVKSTIGTILLPIFVKATSIIATYITFEQSSLFLIMIFGGVLSGFATGLIMKTGFSSGGFNILYQIMHKYFKISVGKASLIINGIVILSSAFILGLSNAIYAIISLYIASLITDKVILGVSKNKAFYIVTKKPDEVKEFISNNMFHTTTTIDAKGGFNEDKKKVLLCVVPTREYYILKEVISKIDEDVFFLITDIYEAVGGK